MATTSQMPETLLVEVGTEELPDGYLARALDGLPGIVSAALSRQRLEHGAIRVLGTPRRLAVIVESLAARQPDEVREVTGPPERVAVDPATGGFTEAAVRFAERYGAGPADLRLVDSPKGRVAGLTVSSKGRSAGEVISAELPEIFCERSIPYPQSMYWEAHTGPFIRPVHWLVVLHGRELVDAELFGVRSGRETRGHRFHAPGPVTLDDARSYEEVLEAHRVIVDQGRRRERLEREIERCVAPDVGVVVPDEELVVEIVAITELPCPVVGRFEERFLALPEKVVVTAMAVHQRYFALRDPQGALVNAFVAVSNTEPRDPDVVRRGFERVLTARLEDARFCYEEDLRRKLADLAPGLDGMVFQKGLGSYLDKTRRLADLAPAVLELLGVDGTDAGTVSEAARLCKADLLTKVVYEFPELQGVMGGEYALREGLPVDVAAAIRDHYRPAGPADELPSTTSGKVLALADRIDTMVGFFALGMAPRGGSDPFGLRRACLGAVRIILKTGSEATFSSLIDLAFPLYRGVKFKVSHEQMRQDMLNFLEGRLKVLWAEDARQDILDACLACGVDSVLRARKRLDALMEFQRTDEFEDLAVAFKRAYRIVKDEKDLPGAPDPALFEQPEESALMESVAKVRDRIEDSVDSGEFGNAFNEFRKLRGPVDAFFEKVFVSVDDVRVRLNRLSLLAQVVRMIEPAARLDLVQFDRTKL